MRLHFLKINAFGPFATTEQIDFSELGENALFLIDGSTGAGKSSILHAICYALYGKTTDLERKDMGLRCDHAAMDNLTEVALEFSIREDRYRITRSPTQIRLSKRNDKNAQHKAAAHLCRVLADGSEQTLVAKKKNDADEQIKAIIGLTLEQFRQVMVLPQGQFRALLLANSTERQAILSTLFQTEIYKRIEEILKVKAADIEKQYQHFEERKQNALLDVSMQDDEALLTEIQQLKIIVSHLGERKQQLDNKKQHAFSLLKKAEDLTVLFLSQQQYQTDYAVLQQQAVTIQQQQATLKLHHAAQKINAVWQQLQTNNQQLINQRKAFELALVAEKKSTAAMQSADKQFSRAVEDYQQRDGLYKALDFLERCQNQSKHYTACVALSTQADTEHQQLLQHQLEVQVKISEQEQAIQTFDLDAEGLEQKIANKMQLSAIERAAKKNLELAQQLVAEQDYLKRLTENHQKGLDKRLSIQQYLNEAALAVRNLEQQWLTNQAAVLAQDLQENEPCLVCGSVEHPKLAHFPAETTVITQDSVKAARKREATYSELSLDIEKKIARSEQDLNNRTEIIQGLVQQLGNDGEQPVALLEQRYQQSAIALQQISVIELQLENLKQHKREKNNQYHALLQQSRDYEQQLPRLSLQKAEANAQLKTIINSLPIEYQDSGQLLAAINDKQQQIHTLESAYQAAQRHQQQAQLQQSEMQVRLDVVKNNLADLQQQQTEQAGIWQQCLAESDFDTQQDFEQAQLSMHEQDFLQQEVKCYDEKLQGLQAKLSLLAEQLANQQPPDIEALQIQLQEYSTLLVNIETEWLQAQQRYYHLVDTEKKIKRLTAQQAVIKEDYNIVGTLSKTASGSGHIKVSLERFVLSNLFNLVLNVASQRLHVMSKGQYRLILQNDAEQKKNTSAGLDLAIDDAHTGKIRPVATLSGGESFLASLALALALSDVVQQRSGGIQLDTLFIDEGFGSLDQESLQLAINTLVDLQSTGRMIGIISHVSELKEQMALRIEVSRSRSGSHIKTIAAYH